MMMDKRMTVFAVVSAVAAICSSDAYCQTIDPTVEVTRDYVGKLIEVHKPLQTMPVPDSLQRFDLQFDYSIYDSPYKGSLEFSPLRIGIDPVMVPDRGRRLLLRAGAGYALQPVLDVVWSPLLEGRFRMSVYGSHRSYIGRYRDIGLVSGDGGQTVVGDLSDAGDNALSPASGPYSGHDMSTCAGMAGSVYWEGGRFYFDASYRGIAMKDRYLSRNYDAVDVRAGVVSDECSDRRFVYDASVRYRYGEDVMTPYVSGTSRTTLPEHLFNLSASLGPVFSGTSRALVDVGLNFADYSRFNGEYAGDFSIVPRYVYRKGRWALDLGIRFAVTMHNSPGPQEGIYGTVSEGQFVYPDVRIGFEAIREHLEIYVSADGGNTVSSWSEYLDGNHYYNPFLGQDRSSPLGNTLERISAFAGIEGNVASRLSYGLRAGYVNYGNAFLDGISIEGMQPVYMPGFDSYQMLRADLSLMWKSEDVYAEANVSGRVTDIGVSSSGLFAPAAVSGGVKVVYNWKKRIYAGIDCGFSSARYATIRMDPDDRTICIPGYADLGISLEYRFSRSFSVWLHGGNLLDMAVQTVPLHAESGINFTGGICLNLQ